MSKPDYKGFAQWAVTQGSWNGNDLDGGDIQEHAVKFGIIKKVAYDPKKHGPNDVEVEPGDEWFVFVEARG